MTAPVLPRRAVPNAEGSIRLPAGPAAGGFSLTRAIVRSEAIRQVKQTVVRIVTNRADQETAERLANTLATGTWTHDYPITVGEARDLGMAVSIEVPEEVYDLIDLYPQTSQRRPSVQYVPMPYRGDESPTSSSGKGSA